VKNAICQGLILGLICLGPSGAAAGVIRGTVRLADPRVQASPAGSRPAGTPSSRRDPVQDAVIYLDNIPEKLEKKLARKAALAHVGQAYGRFVPSPLPIAAGTTVEFENQDRVYHNVFSVSPARRFDIGKYAPRASHRVRFDRPGLIKLFCDIDPGETGYIFVTPNHAYTRPDSSGAFALPKLPPGTYRLRVWHPGHKHLARDIVMPRRGDVSLDLRL
jgi:plastocyanin